MLATSRATIAIPARIGSRRIKRKPLVKIDGRPLIVHVVLQALKCDAAHEVVVVTDSNEVADAVAGLCDVLVDDRSAWCGTNRIAAAWGRAPSLFPTKHDATTTIINWQIDEPFVRADDVGRLVTMIQCSPDERRIATLVADIKEPVAAFDHNFVSAAVRGADECGKARAVKFSRSGVLASGAKRHIGVYAFAATALAEIATMARSNTAKRNDLEQLTWMEAKMQVVTADVGMVPPRSIHTMADVEAANEIMGGPRRVRIDARRTG